jgi:putative transposase
MKHSRFSEEQIIAILKEQESGMPTAEVCRRHGISPATFYKWKGKYGGLEVSEAKRLRSLADENAELKKLLAEAMLDIAVLKDITAKKPVLSLSKGGDACRKAGSGGSCSVRVWPERASGLRYHRGIPSFEQLCVTAA